MIEYWILDWNDVNPIAIRLDAKTEKEAKSTGEVYLKFEEHHYFEVIGVEADKVVSGITFYMSNGKWSRVGVNSLVQSQRLFSEAVKRI